MLAAPPAASAATDAREQSAAPGTCVQTPAAEPRGRRQRHVARRLLRVLGASYRDPLFERPDIVENDYYRFLKQPRGY